MPQFSAKQLKSHFEYLSRTVLDVSLLLKIKYVKKTFKDEANEEDWFLPEILDE